MLRYSELIEKLPTRAFLVPLKEDEEVEIELSKVTRPAQPPRAPLLLLLRRLPLHSVCTHAGRR